MTNSTKFPWHQTLDWLGSCVKFLDDKPKLVPNHFWLLASTVTSYYWKHTSKRYFMIRFFTPNENTAATINVNKLLIE